MHLEFLSLFNLARWEKYDAKGWTEKGAHKYGRLNEQSWWEKWGEHYDGRGSVLKWYVLWPICFITCSNNCACMLVSMACMMYFQIFSPTSIL